MGTKFHSFWWAAAGVLFSACVAQSEGGGRNLDAAGQPGSGGAGSGGATPSTGSGGSGSGGAGSGGSGGVAAPVDVAADLAPGDVAGGEGGVISSPASCAEATYAACMDFEKLPDAKWTGIGTNVQMGKAAHGSAAFHGPPNSSISTSNLGAITNVAWGRFYLHMTPKAPVGHGAMVMFFDQPGRGGNWYEVGFEFNALQGNWHGNGGEKYMRTKQLLPDRWVCVEFFMDGASGAPVQLWMDGVPVVYSMVASSPTIAKTNKFSLFSIGLTPYHGFSTVDYEGNAMPMTDMWLDDIALDTKRIGCIGN